MTPKVYKFRASVRVISTVVILLFGTGFVGTIWFFFIHPRGPINYFSGVLCLVGYGFFLKRFAGESLHSISYRLELTDKWVAARDLVSLTVIPFSKLSGFAEEPIMTRRKLSGYRFGFLGAHDEQVLFSTQIVGWAEIIQSVHRSLPDHVPDVRTLEARSVLSSLELSAEAAAYTAPGDNTPGAWRAAHITRWYDFFVGYLLGLAIVWKPVDMLGDYLKTQGVTNVSLVTIPCLVIPCSVAPSFAVSALRRHRQKATKQSPRVERPTPHGPN